MKQLKRLLIFVTAITLSSSAFAEDAAALLQHRLLELKTMRASFSQVVRSVRGRALQRSSGTMALQRPGKFRWYSTRPTRQLVIADGVNLWVYDKDLEQATVRRMNKSIGDTPALFLSGYSNNITKYYQVTANDNKFTLRPTQKNSDFKQVDLSFSGKNLVKMLLIDRLGQKTSLTFSKVRTNLRLSSTLFTFKPPRGVDVVGTPSR